VFKLLKEIDGKKFCLKQKKSKALNKKLLVSGKRFFGLKICSNLTFLKIKSISIDVKLRE